MKASVLNTLLGLGLDKKQFQLKKVGGYLTILPNELNEDTFKMIKAGRKFHVEVVFDGYIVSNRILFDTLGLKGDITKYIN